MRIFFWFIAIITVLCIGIYLSPWRNYFSPYRWWVYTPEKYALLKKDIAEKKSKLLKHLNKHNTDSVFSVASKLFQESLTQRIFPFWQGTDWDFNGKTEIPGRGSVACGYFVTICLHDAGLKIHRDKLAQMASEKMIKELIDVKQIRRYSSFTLPQFLADIKDWGEGIYVVGLDKHTGFLVYEKGAMKFVHSGGRFPAQVSVQDPEDAKSLRESEYRVAGKLTADKALLLNWLNHE